MLKVNQAEFEVLGITKFWEKGYTGKGINIGNTEKRMWLLSWRL